MVAYAVKKLAKSTSFVTQKQVSVFPCGWPIRWLTIFERAARRGRFPRIILS
jgi:hypothetical protein